MNIVKDPSAGLLFEHLQARICKTAFRSEIPKISTDMEACERQNRSVPDLFARNTSFLFGRVAVSSQNKLFGILNRKPFFLRAQCYPGLEPTGVKGHFSESIPIRRWSGNLNRILKLYFIIFTPLFYLN